MDINKKILKAINEGVLNALSFDDELPDTEEVSMKKISNKDTLEIVNKEQERIYYSRKLQEMRPDPLYQDGVTATEHINRKFIDTAIEWHKLYGATYNPHLDNNKSGFLRVSGEFNKFIKDCLLALWDKKEVDLNWIDTSEVTSLYSTFSDIHIMEIDVSEWNTSNVVCMDNTFYHSDFNGDLSKWDVTNVKDMVSMFSFSKFNNDSICNWDMHNVEIVSAMFRYDKIFCLDLSHWDVSNVTKSSNANDVFENTLMTKELQPHFNFTGF